MGYLLHKATILLTLAGALFLSPAAAQTKQRPLPTLLLRLDDIGMSHSVNMAAEKLAQTGIPFSASVQFACPWYQEAVAILKKYPNVSIGVHLTLTSEWRGYRWGPVTGRTAVPSLVDSIGYFYQSTTAFANSGYKIAEVETELSAQIERALASGFNDQLHRPAHGCRFVHARTPGTDRKTGAQIQTGYFTPQQRFLFRRNLYGNVGRAGSD